MNIKHLSSSLLTCVVLISSGVQANNANNAVYELAQGCYAIQSPTNGHYLKKFTKSGLVDNGLSYRFENSSALATAYYDAFIHREDWKDKVSFISDLRKITKQEVMDFAKEFYKENYVVTYKRKGEDKTIAKVENPSITPVELNRGKQSEYIVNFDKMKSGAIKPLFVDYDKKIKKTKLASGLELSYIENETNDLFDLNIILDMGKNNIKNLSHAVSYLKYVGTDKYSAEEIQKEFYKLGVSYGVYAGGDRSYVYISGIKKNMDKGLELFEHLLGNAVANQESYDKYVAKVLKGRENNKTQKARILRSGLMNYGKYGEKSETRNIFSAEELKKTDPKDLVALVKDLKNYKQRLFYYGKGADEAVVALNKLHKTPKKLKDYLSENEFSNIRTLKRKITQWSDNSMQPANADTLKPNRKKQRSKLKM